MIPVLVAKVASVVGISGNLLFSVCFTETGMHNVNNYKDRNGGSFGVCQIALPTAREQLPFVDRLALMQPRVNLLVAAMYLKKLKAKYKGLRETIAVYNAGSVRFVNNDFFNVKYVDKVMRTYYAVNGGVL